MKKIVFYVAIVLVGAAIVYGINIYFRYLDIQRDNAIYKATEELDLVRTNRKVEELKDEIRNKIIFNESSIYETNTGELFLTFDPYGKILERCRRIGGKMNLDCLSFGPLQFKLSTVIYFESRLNGNDITEMEALVIAQDIDKASKLFDDIVYGVEGGIWNWAAAEKDRQYYATVIPIVRKLLE